MRMFRHDLTISFKAFLLAFPACLSKDVSMEEKAVIKERLADETNK